MINKTFFQALEFETKDLKNDLYNIDQVQMALNGKLSLDSYIAYLTQAYHHVKHTTPLLMLAGAKISSDKEFLRNALAEYIEEELGHQEWILNDIKNCGGDPDLVRESQPKFATEIMISYAYDFISRVNPVGFFGMIYVLEGTSINLATKAGEAIMKNLQLNKNCFSYLFSHGSLDLKHMDFFKSLMKEINDRQDQRDIIHMAKNMFCLFGNVLKTIPY